MNEAKVSKEKYNKIKIFDYIKIVENRISVNMIAYIVSILLIINSFFIGRMVSIKYRDVNYELTKGVGEIKSSDNIATSSEDMTKQVNSKLIFGSKKGKYFYYTGCGGSNLSPANLVYYKSEQDAISKGKLLYKGCK